MVFKGGNATMSIMKVDATLARTRSLIEQSCQLLAELNDTIGRTRTAVARSNQVLERLSSLPAVGIVQPQRSYQTIRLPIEPPPHAAGQLPVVVTYARPKRPKRNKLFYKHRWLISRDVVAALRRAGVVCEIVVPEHVGWKQ